MSKRARPKKHRKSRRQRTAVELKPFRRELDGLVKDGKAEQAVELAWDFIKELCGEPSAGPASQSSERIKAGVLVNLIASTTTTTGLTVASRLVQHHLHLPPRRGRPAGVYRRRARQAVQGMAQSEDGRTAAPLGRGPHGYLSGLSPREPAPRSHADFRFRYPVSLLGFAEGLP